MIAPRRFLVIWSAVLLACGLMVGLINLAIDPYLLVRTPPVDGWSDIKADSFRNAREFKAIQVRTLAPERIILGNSRADAGLRADHPLFAANRMGFNLALPSADMPEYLAYFKMALATQPRIDRVLLGVDLVAFRAGSASAAKAGADDPSDFAAANPALLVAGQLLSSSTLFSSLRTVVYSRLDRQPNSRYDPQGNLHRENPPGVSTAEATQQHLRSVYIGGWYQPGLRLGDEHFAALAELAQICRERQIDLQVFISPVHAAQWEMMRLHGLVPLLDTFKRRLVQITPVWDFSGYNTITAEPFGPDMRHYLESAHYRPEVGDLVMRRIYQGHGAAVPADFGHRLTVDNVEQHIERFRRERARWAATHPEEIRLYERWVSTH